MKKTISLICMVLIIGMLSACSGGNSEKTSKDDNKLTAWAWNINVPVLEAAAERYKKENPDFELEIVELGREDVYQKLTTGLQAGGQGLPDIVLVEDDRIQGYAEAYPKAFLDLKKYGFEEQKDKFPTSKTDLLTVNDKVVGFPFDGGPTGVFYRTDMFEEAGVKAEDIETWDQFIEAGKTIKEKTGKAMLGLDLNGDDGLYRMMMNQQGSLYFDDKGELALTSEQSMNAAKVIKQLKDEGLVKNTVGWDAWISAMVSGEVATAPSGAWLSGSITGQGKDTSGKWGVIPLPAFEEGGNRASNLGGSNYVIMENTNMKQEAYDFLEFFSTDEETQLEAMNGGLFPTLNTIYDEPVFTKEQEFFTNQPIWQTFTQQMDSIPSVNYTGNYSVAMDESIKAQSEAVSGKVSIKDAYKAAEDRLKNRVK
ncbi:sugar ABC transporter substrate-binding protein [Metabacillus indicus]|uniref:ABC transporter substrate-binding protein n=1 Tax=Metabacillus indicus TaxID=246786 RepID=UPI002A07F5AA|nr:sugar ABC transporter substrate-binding protein [Metabacillus indicus]MDX8289353.1 sugar ABC transporter substrate-binding protein [Metabacillus indicus]